MLGHACHVKLSWPRISLFCSAMVLLACAAAAQDISIVRSPLDSDMDVRLVDLGSNVVYDRSGGTYFIVPTGRYSVQLLRDDQLIYQEVEYIGPGSPQTRTIDPSGSGIIVGLSGGNPKFEPNLCSALQGASRLAIESYGLPDADLQQRLRNAGPENNGSRCASGTDVDELAATLAGSYGVRPLGMVILLIDYTPLAPRRNLRRPANPNLDANSARPGIAPAQQPGVNLTSSLVADLKRGFSDVAVDVNGKSLLVCAALDVNTPLFCDSDGTVMAPSVNPHLSALYRLHVKTTPVDYRGVEDDHWVSFAGEDEYRATEQKLAQDMQAIETRLLQRTAGLRARPAASGSVVSGAGAKAYTAADVTSLITTTQTEIDQALRNPTLQPLRREFPPLLAQLKQPSSPAVSAGEAETIFQELKATVDILTQVAGNLGIDLIFKTTPVETEGARLTFNACDRCIPVVSQGGEHRFYRGRYHLRAALDGYVPYEGWLDLVADPRTVLECEMVRVRRTPNGQTANGRASTCSLTSQ